MFTIRVVHFAKILTNTLHVLLYLMFTNLSLALELQILTWKETQLQSVVAESSSPTAIPQASFYGICRKLGQNMMSKYFFFRFTLAFIAY